MYICHSLDGSSLVFKMRTDNKNQSRENKMGSKGFARAICGCSKYQINGQKNLYLRLKTKYLKNYDSCFFVIFLVVFVIFRGSRWPPFKNDLGWGKKYNLRKPPWFMQRSKCNDWMMLLCFNCNWLLVSAVTKRWPNGKQMRWHSRWDLQGRNENCKTLLHRRNR